MINYVGENYDTKSMYDGLLNFQIIVKLNATLRHPKRKS